MTYFNSTDEELLATGEYSNYINYAEGIWFDQRTGELMTRDKMILTHLNYWYNCYLQLGKIWKFEKPPHSYKYKHRNSVLQIAKLLGIHLKTVTSLNELYKQCNAEGTGTYESARKAFGKDWRRAIRNLQSKNLLKVKGEELIINPSFVLARDNWPTLSKRQNLKQQYEDIR